VDGEEISARLEDMGHEYVPTGDEAELIIVNTCGFIESAKKESIDAALSIKALWPDKKVLLAGCLAQRYPEEILAEMAEVDGVFGNADLSLIGEAASKAIAGQRAVIAPPQTSVISEPYYSRTRLFEFPGSAHVKITEGCDNRCTYCAIPLIRGGLRSRDPEDIFRECKDLVAKGTYEINLIGQDLGSYGVDFKASGTRPAIDLPGLLKKLSSIEGDFRIRVLYIHPDHFPWGILEAMAEDGRLAPYFDLPFQHASERLLKAMNRRGSSERYLELIARIRSALPESMIRSTFLVGFPGENEEDFEILKDFQRRVKLDWLGVFAYSREEGTPAYSFKDRVTKKLAAARKKEIEDAQGAITDERLRRFIGSSIRVLVEEKVEGETLSLGRGWMQAPDVDGSTVLDGDFAPGALVNARILAVHGVDFEAEPEDTARGEGS
jgi:ribosomal protein S12 methylthiotransferase